MLTYPRIDPIIFSIGPLGQIPAIHVRWYGLMYVIGFVLGWWLARKRAQAAWSIIKPAQVDDLIFYCMLGVVIGGRLGYCLVYGWQDLLRDPLYIFRITQGGMSFHGGLAGVMLAMWLYSRRLGVGTWGVWDFVAPLAPLGLFFGRLGNFINGELWGKATDVPWAFDINGVGLHPSQLYEALLEGLLLFVILWQFSSKERPHMSVSGLFLLCYGVFRFYVEFYRVPDAHLDYLALGWVTMGQVLSAPMILLGALMLFMAYQRPRMAAA
jgi:phosphatidylglycerol---prolipoprotein diacylglyceryl transferase